MAGYILSIIGIVFLEVMLDQILPEGGTNAVIRSVFALLLLYVILCPLAGLTDNINLRQFFEFSLS